MPQPTLDQTTPCSWLVTGAAGFIGSHLVEALLRRAQEVIGLDNFSTGRSENLADVRRAVTSDQWNRFRFVRGDITRPGDLAAIMPDVDRVLHQAALGSVPLSIADPVSTHASNVTGLLEVLTAARAAGVRRVVYASSSAVYGDSTELPAREGHIGRPLSPYALSKRIDEEYADVFERCYGLTSIGLRYFNVCGPRQDPAGAYAAVIPRWIDALLHGGTVEINGDGETSRDFCPVENVVHANLLAATVELDPACPRVFNVGLGAATNLNQLFRDLRSATTSFQPGAAAVEPVYRGFRAGDVRHSCADISSIRRWLGFEGQADLGAGLSSTVRWHAERPAKPVDPVMEVAIS